MIKHENTLTKSRILEIARDKFFQLGFTRVTMDEIARDLGISKRTLYEHFTSKEELLREGLKQMTQEVERTIEGTLRDDTLDFVDKLIRVWTFMASRLSRIGPIFQSDLQRHAPGIWK
ncbi:MAG TPA: helix-turn-helix domain-containing protein, partial [Terriglobia bacterium]|nr:helix-turn-helix domain-containing protein [Terriglobia bacterium]